jgi:dipeptidyl aminopeptidase/acylaminoacyl peptidase
VRDWDGLETFLGRVGLIFLQFAAVAFARQPFATGDWWNWRTAGTPRISTDGRLVVYTESWSDRPANAEFANLWLAPADGSGTRAFTAGPWRDRWPCWSPGNDRIAWISERGGRSEIRIRPLNSPDKEVVIAAAGSPLSLSWSAEGKFLAYTALVPSNDAPPAWAPPAILAYLRPAAPHRHIFVVEASGGAPRQVTADAANYAAPAWMLDSQSLVAVRGGSAIVSIPLAGGRAKVLVQASARFENPLPSPDGRKIAWLATAIRPQSYTIRKLWVMNADGSRARALAGELDRDPQSPQWSSEARTLYFLACDRGSTHVYAAHNDGTVRQVTTRPERLRGFSLADNGRAVSIRSSATVAGDVVSFTVDVLSEPTTPASPNRHLLAERDLGAIEEIAFPSDGRTIQAWVVKPPHFDPAKRYPLLLDIQDAPRRMYGGEIDLRSQIFAARGWVVLHVNPRGTPGYGEEFGNLLRTRYPGDDYDDLMRGADFVLAKGYIDPARMAVSGGLLAAWTIGHTNRFHAAIVRRPIVDWATDVATSPDGPRRASEWMGAMPWDDPDQYIRHSPLYFAAGFETPTLILAGDRDPESDELYFALLQRKVESALVRLPEGNPAARVIELETILGWLQFRLR